MKKSKILFISLNSLILFLLVLICLFLASNVILNIKNKKYISLETAYLYLCPVIIIFIIVLSTYSYIEFNGWIFIKPFYYISIVFYVLIPPLPWIIDILGFQFDKIIIPLSFAFYLLILIINVYIVIKMYSILNAKNFNIS